MKPSEDVMNRFYQNAGKLFFAIAAVDKNVRQEEYEKLIEIIKSDWLQVEDTEDSFGTDAAYQIEFIFDWLEDSCPEPYDCYEEFVEFKRTHEYVFTPKIRQLVWKTAYEVASAFNKRNKSELAMLSKLALELKEGDTVL